MRTNLAKLPYLLLAILVVGSTLFYAANTAATLDSFLNPNRARPPLEHSENARFLVQPLPESRRAGMAAEDEPISVNGVPFTGMAGLIRQTFHAHPGQIFSIVYRNRLGGMHTAQVRLMAQRKAPPNFTGLADQHRAGCPLSRLLSLARLLGGPGQAAGMERLVSAGHHERGSRLQQPNRIFPRLSCALHHLLANLRHPVDAHLADPVQHPFSCPLPYRHSPPLDQVAHHHSPDRRRSGRNRISIWPALPRAFHPTLPLRHRSSSSRGKCLRCTLSLYLHCRHRGQALRRSRSRAGCPPSPGSGGRRFIARAWPGTRPAGNLHAFAKKPTWMWLLPGLSLPWRFCSPYFPFLSPTP